MATLAKEKARVAPVKERMTPPRKERLAVPLVEKAKAGCALKVWIGATMKEREAVPLME
jgi:hypothetical protein